MKFSNFFDLTNFAHAQLFDNVTYPWEVLAHLHSYILNFLPTYAQHANISSQAFLINPEQIYLGEGSVVEAGAYVHGPCWLGKNCIVRHGAYIRGDVLAGDNVVIGHTTEVKNAIFMNNAQAAHFAYVGDSILGSRVNLGAGTKCANFKLDKQTITVQFNNQRIETNRRKLGAIIGDNCQIGCNSVLNPGTVLEKDVCCYPCVNFGGYIPAKSLIKNNKNFSVMSPHLTSY